MKKIAGVILLAFAVCAFASCKHTPNIAPAEVDGYPENVRAIIVNKCATAGCHNDASRQGAGGLSLVTWDKMFEGSRGGAVVIPFRPDYSTLMYYVNSDSTRGIALKPTMPYNAAPLTDVEYNVLKNWITAGAPNSKGFVKFSDNPQRVKFVTANQGCDVATVFDAATMLAMRVVSIGNVPNQVESPHMIKYAPDNSFYCVCFISGNKFQKFSTTENQLIGQVELGSGSWNTFSISPDSKTAYTADLLSGKLAVVNLEDMTAQFINRGLIQPHGTALNEKGDTLYVTGQLGNFLYKMPTDFRGFQTITVNGQPRSVASSFDLHEIHFSPDFGRYFVTCQTSNEVRVLSRTNDSLLAAIPVGGYPQEMAFSKSFPYLFVSCMEDVSTFPGNRGSIYVINYNDYSIVAKIYAGHQSHGIAVDDINKRVYVTNRNKAPGGPAPHHSSVCGGPNGYITAIDLQTLRLIPDFKAEVSVDPYGIGITH